MVKIRTKGWVYACLCAIALVFCPFMAVAQPTAHFELRLAPSEDDSVLVLGDPTDDTLDLEVWVEVEDAVAPVWAFSMFLKASADNVISFNEDFAGVPFVSFPCVYNGTNNSPFMGDFSPACFEPTGTMAGIDSPALYGTFSVSAIGEGEVSYIFDGSDPIARPWEVGFTDTTTIPVGDLSFSIDSAVAEIEVVTTPPITPSADADNDGDVDLDDYRILARCAVTSNGVPTGVLCEVLDLNTDGVISHSDVPLFAQAMSGPIGPADIEGDRDVDLADFGRFQICLVKAAMPGMDDYCDRADVDRDGDIDLTDFSFFEIYLAGPSE